MSGNFLLVDMGKSVGIHDGFRISFEHFFDDALGFLGPQEPPGDSPPDRIEQLAPILQWRLQQGLPLVVAPFALVKKPASSKMFGIHFAAFAFGCLLLPTDLGFVCHV